ncbi:hypothetical protein [Nocardia aurantia]|uniref:Uncharacterized protein n=1 Tax=Nocardia aurantia TaxID=2585199 RepID=A0A7K0DLX9_9NOCA|nr:hypothetical protein [Nocardia aurantia]MQY26657.1 hypothetical protein [Nocardia aurantia]
MFESASRAAADAAHLISDALAKAGRTVAGNVRRFGRSTSEHANLLRAHEAESAIRHRNTLFRNENPETRSVPGVEQHTDAPLPLPEGAVHARVAETGWNTDPITLRSHITDAGTVIPPRSLSEGTFGAPAQFDGLFTSRAGLTELFRMNIEGGVRLDRLEPRTPINPHFNCHGYTFSREGEAGWLAGRRVEDILSDNGFRRLSETDAPVPGDVVIYRNSDSVITHSGVVADANSAEVHVDSKQGPLSVVRHRLTEVTGMYGSDVSIYRTERPDGRFLTPVRNSTETAPPWPPTPPPEP